MTSNKSPLPALLSLQILAVFLAEAITHIWGRRSW